jgi:two-component system nitrogen regulation sensor histidine kinase NtrY
LSRGLAFARRLGSIEFKVAGWMFAAFVLGAALATLFAYRLPAGLRVWWLVLPVGILAARPIARHALRSWTRMLSALEAVIASYRDGDFTVSLIESDDDELGRLLRMHNEFAQTLREQRRNLLERELLLDTVVENTPVALVLTDAQGRVTFANIAARQLFNNGTGLDGRNFSALLAALPPAVNNAVAAGEDTLFNVTLEGFEETFHLSQRTFRLQGQSQRLHLFRRMTRELSRQEVAIWKKVIRVVSHEINNSLAPISSMAHSGAELSRLGKYERLPDVFSAIRQRSDQLHGFIDGYARVAKLPAPRPELTRWNPFVGSLAEQVSFRVAAPLPDESALFDRAQIAQALINLIKNAHESGSPRDAVELSVRRAGNEFRIEILDRGSGMNPTVHANALLPFYSTKRSGTGLGLALTREIIEAHGGRIQLSNRPGGGTCVVLALPVQDATFSSQSEAITHAAQPSEGLHLPGEV